MESAGYEELTPLAEPRSKERCRIGGGRPASVLLGPCLLRQERPLRSAGEAGSPAAASSACRALSAAHQGRGHWPGAWSWFHSSLLPEVTILGFHRYRGSVFIPQPSLQTSREFGHRAWIYKGPASQADAPSSQVFREFPGGKEGALSIRRKEGGAWVP